MCVCARENMYLSQRMAKHRPTDTVVYCIALLHAYMEGHA